MNKLQKWSHILLQSVWKRMCSFINRSISHTAWCKYLLHFCLQTKIAGKVKIKFLKYEQTTKVKSHFVTICMKRMRSVIKGSISYTLRRKVSRSDAHNLTRGYVVLLIAQSCQITYVS